ncbi:hypothetical protein D3C80_1829550 [compost metagenome]
MQGRITVQANRLIQTLILMIPRGTIVAGGFAADIGVLCVELLVGQATEYVPLIEDFRTAIGKESVAGGFYCQNSP